MNRNSYTLLGLGLIVAGVGLIPVSHLLLQSVPITALGMSLVILGAVCFVLGRTRPRLSPEVSAILLETGLENIGMILEELGLKTKAIYIPSSLCGGQPRALLPLHDNPSFPQVRQSLPRRLIVKYGAQPEDIGLLISTPGSTAVGMLQSKPGADLGEIEIALASVLEGMLDLVDGVKIGGNEEMIFVHISAPRMEYRKTVLYECLGSPMASIVASLIADALDKPVVISSEVWRRGNSTIEVRVLG